MAVLSCYYYKKEGSSKREESGDSHPFEGGREGLRVWGYGVEGSSTFKIERGCAECWNVAQMSHQRLFWGVL